jgi:hypothetical protein
MSFDGVTTIIICRERHLREGPLLRKGATSFVDLMQVIDKTIITSLVFEIQFQIGMDTLALFSNLELLHLRVHRGDYELAFLPKLRELKIFSVAMSTVRFNQPTQLIQSCVIQRAPTLLPCVRIIGDVPSQVILFSNMISSVEQQDFGKESEDSEEKDSEDSDGSTDDFEEYAIDVPFDVPPLTETQLEESAGEKCVVCYEALFAPTSLYHCLHVLCGGCVLRKNAKAQSGTPLFPTLSVCPECRAK